MKKTILFLFATVELLLTCAVFADNIDTLPLHEYDDKNTQILWFTNSLFVGDNAFDSWTISSGYHLSLMRNINIYLVTEMSTETNYTSSSKGVLSGIEYHFSERITFDSNLQAERIDQEIIRLLGMSSKIKLTEQINLQAKFDFNLNESLSSSASYQVGVGYQF